MHVVSIPIDAYYPFDYPSFTVPRDDLGPRGMPLGDFGSVLSLTTPSPPSPPALPQPSFAMSRDDFGAHSMPLDDFVSA
tara:strand:+ start:560 stop:796 length:237 start_codon:yes stop_codon:yes gene_type:complete